MPATIKTAARNRIDGVFAAARAANRGVVICYLTAGYPDAATSAALLRELPRSGAGIIELGIPFSDPIADGPVIQHASKVALDGGMTFEGALELARGFREANAGAGLVLFGAANPFLVRGESQAAGLAADAGADGILAADLPVEESGPLREACVANGLQLISLIATTTSPKRIALIAESAAGFIYCIARKGVTGAQGAAEDAREYLRRVRAATSLPLALGFGISKPEHVRDALAAGADGVVVGSAIIEAIDTARKGGGDVVAAVGKLVRELVEAAEGNCEGPGAGGQ